MRIGKLGLTIITKAPKWNALVLNENTKAYVDLPINVGNRDSLSMKSKSRESSGKLALFARNSGNVKQIRHFKTYECWVIKKGDPVTNIPEAKITQLWIATDIKAPPQIAQLFCSHLGIPAKRVFHFKQAGASMENDFCVRNTFC